MTTLQQALRALWLSIEISAGRPRHLLLVVSGFLIAGATLASLLTIPQGIARLGIRTGLPDIAVVDTGLASSGGAGGLGDAELIALIGNLPGVVHGADGKALVAPLFVVDAKLRRRDGVMATIALRGVSPDISNVLGDSVRLVSGSKFEPGLRELIAGKGVAQDFVRLDTDAQVPLRKEAWRVSGTFDAGGGLWESELWMDIGSLQDAWNAPGRISSVWVKLKSADSFDAFANALTQDSTLRGLVAVRQTDYYRFQIGYVQRYTRIAAWGVAMLLGLVAVLAIANALGLALKARHREMRVMRALGFCQGALAVAMILEVVLLSALCAAIVLVVGWLLLDGRSFSSATLSQAVRLDLQVDLIVAGWTLLYCVGLGVLAALLPIRDVLQASLVQLPRDS